MTLRVLSKDHQADLAVHTPPFSQGRFKCTPPSSSTPVVKVQGELYLADAELFMESRGWSLCDYPAHLADNEFAICETARGFEIDVDGRQITYHFMGRWPNLSSGWDAHVRQVAPFPDVVRLMFAGPKRSLTDRSACSRSSARPGPCGR